MNARLKKPNVSRAHDIDMLEDINLATDRRTAELSLAWVERLWLPRVGFRTVNR